MIARVDVVLEFTGLPAVSLVSFRDLLIDVIELVSLETIGLALTSSDMDGARQDLNFARVVREIEH